MGVLAFLFVKTLVTETKGRSLEEIEADLQKAATGSVARRRSVPGRPAASR
jgi:hypothetical protein